VKPRIAAGVLADLLAAAPGRVRKRLDADPGAAATWPWGRDGDTWTVTAGAETVRLDAPGGVVTEASQARCSCLLSPRCVHLLAVLSTLDVDAPFEPPEPPSDIAVDAVADATEGVSPGEAPGTGARVELDGRQEAAVALAWQAGARLLAVGATGGTLPRVDLLRAAHACQHAGLYRLGAAAVRVATGVHDLAAGVPEFELAGLADDLAELLTVAWRLGGGPRRDGAGTGAAVADVGVARRRYEPVGSLRLHGLFSEAVVAGSGHAGVVTHALDAGGRPWTIPDVAPGAPERAASAYGSAVRFGQLALQHRELGRSEVLAQGASGSADGRLGSGGGVTGTRAGPSRWDAPPLAERWSVPLEDQVGRVLAARDAAGGAAGRQPRGGDDLVFLDAVVHGPAHGGVGLVVRNAREPAAVTGLAASDHDTLEYLPNLRRLAAMAGAGLLLIGRVRFDRPRSVTLLAAGGPGLSLPAPWHGRANLGLDRLAGGHTRADAADAVSVAARADGPAVELPAAPLDGLRRVALRTVLGGRATLAAPAWSGIAGEAARLRRRHLVTAADLLERLAAAGIETRRSFTGERFAPPPDHLARVWTATMTYLRAADHALLRAAWTPAEPPADPSADPAAASATGR
jgi:hypothetical protein